MRVPAVYEPILPGQFFVEVKLTRTKFGNIPTGHLKPGEWRFLTPKEVQGLLQIWSRRVSD